MTGGATSLGQNPDGSTGMSMPGEEGKELKTAQLSVNNVKKVWGTPAAEEKKPEPVQDVNNVQKHVESHYQGSGNLSLNKPS